MCSRSLELCALVRVSAIQCGNPSLTWCFFLRSHASTTHTHTHAHTSSLSSDLFCLVYIGLTASHSYSSLFRSSWFSHVSICCVLEYDLAMLFVGARPLPPHTHTHTHTHPSPPQVVCLSHECMTCFFDVICCVASCHLPLFICILRLCGCDHPAPHCRVSFSPALHRPT